MTSKQPKVVQVDKLEIRIQMEEEREELAKVNAEIAIADWSTEDDIINVAKDADAVLTDAAPITRRVLDSLRECKVVVSYGIGYNHIDVDAATDNGILVVNIPDFCLEEVSNHAITMLLVCAKKLMLMHNGTKQGRWTKCKKALAPMGSIKGQTLGLVGCGKIGRLTAKKAQCFGLTVLGHDPYVDESLVSQYSIKLMSLPELLQEADYVSVHAPLSKETYHLIGEKELKMMKPSAYLINTSRGSVIDESALIRALQENWIAGAGLDVFEREPVDPGNPLLKMDNVVVSPHSAFYSDAASRRLKRSVGEEAALVLSGRWPRNVVNQSVKPKAHLTKENAR